MIGQAAGRKWRRQAGRIADAGFAEALPVSHHGAVLLASHNQGADCARQQTASASYRHAARGGSGRTRAVIIDSGSALRGEAYLAAGQDSAAAAEFQKLIDHRGITWSCTTGALARLGLGRAYALAGDKTKAHAAYPDFLAL